MAVQGDIDISFLTWLFGGIAAVMTTVGGALLAFSHGLNSKAIDSTSHRVDVLAEARVELERRLAAYPTREDVYNLRNEMDKLMREMRDDLESNLGRTFDALNQRITENMRTQLAESNRATMDMMRSIIENRAPIKTPL
jgi:hypothetical protein